MDALLEEFQTGPVKAVGYADDIPIIISGIGMGVISKNVHLAPNKVVNCGKERGLRFNPNKAQSIIFEKSRIYKVSPPRIVPKGRELTFSDSLEFQT